MKKKFVLLLSAFTLFTLMLTGCTETQYEKDSNSGFEKFSNGDFDSMTDREREAVNDFLEWQAKQQGK